MVAAIVALSASLLPAMATSGNAQTLESLCRRQSNTTSLDAYFTHEELGERLEWIESTSRGNVDLEVAGYTNQGREIWAATVGTGPEVILIQSEIHGNEKTGTNRCRHEAWLHVGCVAAQCSATSTTLAVRGAALPRVPRAEEHHVRRPPPGGARHRRRRR